MTNGDARSWLEQNRTPIIIALGVGLLVEQAAAAVRGEGFQPVLVGAALALLGFDRVLPKVPK